MKSWEIVESINAVGYVKTLELLVQHRRDECLRRARGDLTWEEIVERNKRNPPVEREAGEEG